MKLVFPSLSPCFDPHPFPRRTPQKRLRKSGRLVEKATYTHSYPFCWRSDTPLIYKAVPSWFVAVQVSRPNARPCSRNGAMWRLESFPFHQRLNSHTSKLRPTHATPQFHQTVKERLLANNAQTYWVPAFVKENRFHNWLADAKARLFPFFSLHDII